MCFNVNFYGDNWNAFGTVIFNQTEDFEWIYKKRNMYKESERYRQTIGLSKQKIIPWCEQGPSCDTIKTVHWSNGQHMMWHSSI